jgi:hypothetical protein
MKNLGRKATLHLTFKASFQARVRPFHWKPSRNLSIRAARMKWYASETDVEPFRSVTIRPIVIPVALRKLQWDTSGEC